MIIIQFDGKLISFASSEKVQEPGQQLPQFRQQPVP
jgi:hypothetical protein